MINGKKYIMHTNLAITICKSQRNESLGINTPDFLALKRSFFCHSAEKHKSPRRGAESNQNFRSSIYASGDPIISYQIQISLASLIIQCY